MQPFSLELLSDMVFSVSRDAVPLLEGGIDEQCERAVVGAPDWELVDYCCFHGYYRCWTLSFPSLPLYMVSVSHPPSRVPDTFSIASLGGRASCLSLQVRNWRPGEGSTQILMVYFPVFIWIYHVIPSPIKM